MSAGDPQPPRELIAKGIHDELRGMGCSLPIDVARRIVDDVFDREPQPSDGPEYHQDHAFWKLRKDSRVRAVPSPLTPNETDQ